MGCRRRHIVLALCSLYCSLVSAAAPLDAPHVTRMNLPAAPGLMQDGIVFAG
jgi:hypothetical protein